MENHLRTIAEKALDAARRKRVEAEVFILKQRGLSLEVSDARVETLKEAEEMGLGLRVINGGRLGFVYSSDMSAEAIRNAVDDAVTISQYTEADDFNSLPAGNYDYPRMNLYDEKINNTSLEEKIEMAREVERAARASDERIKIIERAGYEDGEFASLVMSTKGVYAYGRGNFSGVYISLVAQENGDAQSGFAMMIKKKINALEPKTIGREAAHRAVRSLNARTIGSEQLNCIMEPYVATRFLNIIARCVDAEAVQKGKSLLADKMGQQVAAKGFNLVDDATNEEGIASFPFDGEGVPARQTPVIQDGILQSFLYDNYTAQKAGVESTGNGQRGSFRSLPTVSPSNFILEAGQQSPEKLIAEIKRGFYITDVMGMHTANPVSGDFSVGAAGLMIENGALTFAVRGVTIAGNIVSFLKDIDAVGNDLRFYGGKAAPSVRLRCLSVAGE